jgi:hypothetical protein
MLLRTQWEIKPQLIEANRPPGRQPLHGRVCGPLGARVPGTGPGTGVWGGCGGGTCSRTVWRPPEARLSRLTTDARSRSLMQLPVPVRRPGARPHAGIVAERQGFEPWDLSVNGFQGRIRPAARIRERPILSAKAFDFAPHLPPLFASEDASEAAMSCPPGRYLVDAAGSRRLRFPTQIDCVSPRAARGLCLSVRNMD